MDIKVFFLYTITAIGCFIFLKYKKYIDKCVTKSMEKIGILWQLIVMPLFFYGIHKATYEIYLETNNDELGSEYGLILYLVLINLLCIAYTLEKLAKAFSEKRSFFSQKGRPLRKITAGVLFKCSALYTNQQVWQVS